MASQTSSDGAGAFGHFLLGALIVALTAAAYFAMSASPDGAGADGPRSVAPIH